MDHKSWLWKKKTTEKVTAGGDHKSNGFSPIENDQQQEMEILLSAKAELENELKNVTEELSVAISECNAKEDVIKKQTKASEETMEGWKKAEAKVTSLKKELDAVLQQRAAGEERLVHFDGALKECKQQLNFVRQEQERRIHDAVMKTTMEFEKAQLILEEKLAEMGKKLGKLGVENNNLGKVLVAKEKLIYELSKQKAQFEADCNGLLFRLESMEKDNASLQYEIRVLEKELEIRNEEREFNRRTAEASHKQHLESVKKIAKLESECQRLRVLVRKRLPGPAALAKMKSEVEVLGGDSVQVRRRRSNTTHSLSVIPDIDNSPNTPTKKIALLIEQLHVLEEDNRVLREALDKKALKKSRAMFASPIESQFDGSSKRQTPLEPSGNCLPVTEQEIPLPVMSDIDSDDKASCAESWASALITELDHFKHGKLNGSPSSKTIGTLDLSLMDDFVEMEKLATASVDKEFDSPHVSSEHDSEIPSQEMKFKDITNGKSPRWLADIIKILTEQSLAAKTEPDEVLKEVKVALANKSKTSLAESINTRESERHIVKPRKESSVMASPGESGDTDSPPMPDLEKSVRKIIELIEGTSLLNPEYNKQDNLYGNNGSYLPYKNLDAPSGYTVRVFQWKTFELSSVLQKFAHCCNDFLIRKSNVKNFAEELTTALEWIMNHCFSLQDVSSMRDAIKKQFNLDETRSENEEAIGVSSEPQNADKPHGSLEQVSRLPITAASNCHSKSEKEEFQSTFVDDGKELKKEMVNGDSAKIDSESRKNDKSESLIEQLQESEKTITVLKSELENLKNSKEIMEAQIENHKLTKEDLDTKLTVAKAELNAARHTASSFELELENKTTCCEQLEATCLELQLQLESVTKTATPNREHGQEDEPLRTEWEITAASEKLAECQETILNLGKQLKALASSRDASLFDKVILSPNRTDAPIDAARPASDEIATQRKSTTQRSSLLDRMIADDDAATTNSQSTTRAPDENSTPPTEPAQKFLSVSGSKHHNSGVAITSLAIVPSKKHGGRSLWKKLLWRKKSYNSKKTSIHFVP